MLVYFLNLVQNVLNETKIPMSVIEIWNYVKDNKMNEELNSINIAESEIIFPAKDKKII